jgi:hypothetical protein
VGSAGSLSTLARAFHRVLPVPTSPLLAAPSLDLSRPPRREVLSIVDYTHRVMAMAIGFRRELHIFEVLQYYFQYYI